MARKICGSDIDIYNVGYKMYVNSIYMYRMYMVAWLKITLHVYVC